MTAAWPWIALFLLGAYHGINPGMGWLFALALGMQERSARAVMRALLPLGLGHVLSVALVVIAIQLAAVNLSQRAVRIAASAALIGFGVYKLLVSRHPRWVGMRVSVQDLTLWSFLMASAHGAGLMLAPILLGLPGGQHAQHVHGAPLLAFTAGSWFWPVAVHTSGYLLLTGAVALLVYAKFGVAILRQAWFNLDLLWAWALVGMGVFTLLASAGNGESVPPLR